MTAAAAPNASENLSRMRWGICGLLFFATTLNYIDRQVIGLLKPVLEKDLGWREADYGWIVFAFQASYAAMMPLAGRLVDALGIRLGYFIAVALWSAAASAHALANTAMQFGLARFGLGFGESANFPAALKTVATWFPVRERALATGLFNSGANIGAIIAPMAVPWLAIHYGWRSAFLVTGGAGIVWLVLWWSVYRDPASTAAEAAAAPRVSYASLLKDRMAWAYLIGKFLTDPVWWFYLYWLPGFLNRTYHLDLLSLGLPIIVIYQASTVGSIGGGWISSVFIRRGWSLDGARKMAMLICAVTVLPVMFVNQTGGNLWLAVLFISFGAAGHQGWSANIYNLPADALPPASVASVVGLGGMGGAVGGMIVAPAVGYWLDFSHGAYGPLFVAAGTMYLLSLGIIQLLVPRIKTTNFHAPVS